MTEHKKDISIDPETLTAGSFVQHVETKEFHFVRSVLYHDLFEVDYITDTNGQNINFNLIKGVAIDKTFHESCWIDRNAFGQYIYETLLPQGNVEKIIFTDYRVFLQQPNKPKPEIVTIWDNELKGRSMHVHEFQSLYKLLTGKNLVFDTHHLIKQNQKVQEK
jgi:hypothetical protein